MPSESGHEAEVKKLQSATLLARLEAGRVLAEFANLLPEKVAHFRKKYPAFVPDSWWDYLPTDRECNPLSQKQWLFTQELVREAWQNGFKIGQFDLFRLLMSVFDSDHLLNVMIPLPRNNYLPRFVEPNEMPEEIYPLQGAVMFLFEQNWRAIRCKRCQAYWAANGNQAEYCNRPDREGITCSTHGRAETRQNYEAKHKEQRNRKKREGYRQQNPSRKSPKRLKGQNL